MSAVQLATEILDMFGLFVHISAPLLRPHITGDCESTFDRTFDPTLLNEALASHNYGWKANTSKRFPNIVAEGKQFYAAVSENNNGSIFTAAQEEKMFQGIIRIFNESTSRLEELKRITSYENNGNFFLPDQFNAATDELRGWKRCASVIEHVSDQMVATVAALSDRTCIASVRYQDDKDELFLQQLSTADIMRCCADCPICVGGAPLIALQYWLDEGLVTGGDYEDKFGCMPYILKACGSPCAYSNFLESEESINKTCPDRCSDGSAKEKYKGINAYSVGPGYGRFAALLMDRTDSPAPNDEIQKFVNGSKNLSPLELERMMKWEILERGPVTACTDSVLLDFNFYQSGIYEEYGGPPLFGHCMKVIGWGQNDENNVKYWHVVNSYGSNWGNNGMGKIMINGKKGRKPFFNIFYGGVVNHRPVTI